MIPGAGHLLIGQRGRGIFLFVALIPTFVVGLAIGGFRNVSLERQPISFAAQVGIGSTCAIGWVLSRRLPAPPVPPKHLSLGTLYTAVAALLNLLCVLDVYERVIRMNLPDKGQSAHKNGATDKSS